MLPGWKRNPNTMTALKDAAAAEVSKCPTGVSRRSLFERLRVGNPSLEENRGKVWRAVAALAGLQRDGDVVSDVYEGERWYYPRKSA